MQNPHFGSKIKIQKTRQKPFYKSFTLVVCKKNAGKTPNIRKMKKIWNRPSCKGYKPCKILTLGQKLKFKKHVKIHSTNHLHYFCAKNSSKKHQIFENSDHFQYRPLCISPCKILTLGQKLTFQKTCQNPLYNSCRVVLWKNRSKKH